MILFRFVFREVLKSGFGVFALLFIISLGGGVYNAVMNNVNFNLPLFPLLQAELLQGPAYALYVLPFAALFATVLFLSRLYSTNEFHAMLSTGVFSGRIYLPIFVFSLLLCFAGLFIGERLEPAAYRERDLIYDRLGYRRLILQEERVFLRVSKGTFLYFKYANLEKNRFTGVCIVDVSPYTGEIKKVFFGQAASLVADDEMKLEGVEAYFLDDGKVVWKGRFDTLGFLLPYTLEEIYKLQKANLSYHLSGFKLIEEVENLKSAGADATALEFRVHRRFALYITPFVFTLFAVPLSLLLARKGFSASLAGALGVSLLYYVLTSDAALLAKYSVLSPVLAAWGVPLLFLLLSPLLYLFSQR